MWCLLQHGPNAASSSQTSVGGGSGSAASGGAGPAGARGAPPGPSAAGGAKFRHGLLQLMIHTIDPLHDGTVQRGYTCGPE